MRFSSIFIIVFVLILSNSCSIGSLNSRVPSSIDRDTSCTKVAANFIETNEVNEELANISGIKYLTQKISEIKHLDASNLYAMQLRAILVTGNKGKTVEEIPLSKLRAIHPINRGASLEKTKARAVKIKSYIEEHGLPRVFNTDIQEETIKSRLLMRAVKTDNDDYIIFDGNGRLFALREYFDNHSLENMLIDVEVYDVDYKRIKHLIEIRRKHLYETGEDVSRVRSILYHKEISNEELDQSISEIKYLGKRYKKLARVSQSTEFKNLSIELSQTVRELENIKLWRESGYAKAFKQGITESEIEDMVLKNVPLGLTKKLFETVKDDLAVTLKTADIEKGHVVLEGMSTSFYSTNSSERVGKYFTKDGINKTGYTFTIHSEDLSKKKNLDQENLKWTASDMIYSKSWIEEELPSVKVFRKKWSKILKRKVKVVGENSQIKSPESHGNFIIDLSKED